MSLVAGDPVTGPGLGDDQRCGPRRLQLGAQPPYVDAQVLGFRLVAAAPDPAQQVRAGQQLAPVQRQFAQQRELRGREVHDGPGAADLLPDEVDLYVADRDDRGDGLLARLGGPGAAGRGPDPGGELLDPG